MSILGFQVVEGRGDKSLSMNSVTELETRTQMLIRKQKELWRKYRFNSSYPDEIRAQILTKEWQRTLKENPPTKDPHKQTDLWDVDEQCVTRVHKQPRRN